MNWFQRYGIPGAYFVGLMAGWVYAFNPDLWKNQAFSDHQWLLALAAIAFLPIGYVISIFGQVVYLNWRRCFARYRWLRGWLGFHGAAMDTAGVKFLGFRDDQPTQYEAIIEARTLLLTALTKRIPVRTHQYIRDWIARRMDVVAMNQSIFSATLFAMIIAVVFFRPFQYSIALAVLSGISTFVIIVMIVSIMVLRRQVIEVIAGIYRTHKDDKTFDNS